MKPTDKQLRDPKWWDENAPEGATHLDLEDGDWMRLDPETGLWYATVDGPWRGPYTDFTVLGNVLDYAPRPTTPAWNGEGLPPVGATCEFMTTRWRSGRVVCYVDGMHGRQGVVQFDDDWQCFNPQEVEAGRVRPLRTPEQREKERLSEVVATACTLRAGIILDELQYDKIADAILAKYELKERDQ